jgi:putative membrane protein
MIRAIASHYGMRPGVAGSLTLLKRVLQNLVTAGASHYVSDALAETIGSDLAGNLSRRFSEGAINGLMSVRLGLMAAELCRPLPFQPEDKHSFRQLFRNVRKRNEHYAGSDDGE